jgi:hypothetical protein
MENSNRNFKQEAHALVDQLPDNATWYDLMFSAGERYDIESGYSASYSADMADYVQTPETETAEQSPAQR